MVRGQNFSKSASHMKIEARGKYFTLRSKRSTNALLRM
jgi:hypothetical protein